MTKLYHGTKWAIWELIQREGITKGFFGTDTLYPLWQWSENNLLLEVLLDDRFVDRGMRIERGMGCRVYQLKEGCIIHPREIRLIPVEELKHDIEAVKQMTQSKYK